MIQEKYDIVVADTSCLIFFHKFVGSIGTILKAKELNLIDDLKPIKEKIQKSNFRLSEEILNLLN